MKPLIGITTFNEQKLKKVNSTVSNNYVNSILLAGGVPILIPINNNNEHIEVYLDKLDGLLFTGGEDVAPRFYNENPTNSISYTSSLRDEFELNLFHKAYKRDMPIFGICRGAQLINVALGGSLIQDIDKEVSQSKGHSPEAMPVDELYHSVNILKNSKLYDIFKTEKLYVNSFHHQAVKELADGLKITAVSSDNIVEAYESVEKEFLLAVQWHPEDLTRRYKHFIDLFAAFVNTCIK